MSAQDVIFILIALATAGGAVLTVISRNLVHAALFLAIALAGIAATFLLLRADFLGLVQVVVYLGAITVLFLFGLMLTRAPIGREALDSRSQPMALAVSGTLFVVLTFLIVSAFRDVPTTELAYSSIADIGIAIFSVWVFPFEVASMLLLAALVGAVMLARRESGESGEEGETEIILDALPTPGDVEADRREAEIDAREHDAVTASPNPPGGGL